MKHVYRYAIGILCANLLAACGGGSSGGGESPPSEIGGAAWARSDFTLSDGGTLTYKSRTSTGAQITSPLHTVTYNGILAFASEDSTLTSFDFNGAADVFVLNTDTNKYDLVSLSTTGQQGNRSSALLAGYEEENNLSRGSIGISENGRYIAFASDATNLTPDDSNDTTDIFVRDRGDYYRAEDQRRIPATTFIASTSGAGAQNTHPSFSPSVSNYRNIAFVTAGALVPGDTNGTYDVYVKDLATGSITRASVASDGTQGIHPSFDPAISDNGNYVAFASWSDNLVANDTNHSLDIFVRNLSTGETRRVSLGNNGQEANRGIAGPDQFPNIKFPGRLFSMSHGGRHIAFLSDSSNLTPGDINGKIDAFLRDTLVNNTIRVSQNTTGSVSGASALGISVEAGDGLYQESFPSVTFVSDQPLTGTQSSGLSPAQDVYVREIYANKLVRLTNSRTDSFPMEYGRHPMLSTSGLTVLFSGSALDIIPGDHISGLFQSSNFTY